jgi:hypothetical protein
MAILWSNNASTTVSGSITTGSTTVQLAAGTGALFPQPTGGDYFVATFYDQATKTINEIVHVTNITGDVATIVRGNSGFGVDATNPQAWNAGDIFSNLVTAGTLKAFVQAGTGPTDTSVVFVGIDTSVTPNLIVAVTNPVPTSYAPGMMFNIKVANTNTGPVNVQLNGTPSVVLTRTDGSAMVAGNLTAGEEYTFIYGGGASTSYHFDSTIPPIPRAPPQTTFYVRADSTSVIDANGIESNTGFANTTTDAFKSIQGAINTIKSRYISQNTVTIRVADGYYTSGFGDSSNYIASWSIIGNAANPGNVTIDATSTNAASYVPGAPHASCIESNSACVMSVNGFNLKYLYQGVVAQAGGNLSPTNIWFNASSNSGGTAFVGGGGGGNMFISGNFQYSGNVPNSALISCGGGATINIGSHDPYFGSIPVSFNMVGAPNFTNGVCGAASNGSVGLWGSVVSWNGVQPIGRQYNCSSCGGIVFIDGPSYGFPGSQAGTLDAATYGWVR